MSFLEVFWYILIVFVFFAYLIILFQIFGDLFRNHEMGGFSKAIWVIALIVFTWIAALIYLIANGKGMAARSQKAAQEMQAAQTAYIRDAAGTAGPADQIARAKELLDSGAITQAEFDSIKAKALAS
jgi:Short C-terminal domain